MRRLSTVGAALIAVSALIGCGGAQSGSSGGDDAASSDKATSGGSASTDASSSSSVKTPPEPAELQVRDDTAVAAMETYLEGIKQGKMEIALAVLHPDSPGAIALTKMMAGWKKAKEDGAPVEIAIAYIAGEVDALTYEKTTDDGSFATFRFTTPTKEEPWEIEAIKTPEGWRIKPPDSGLPTG